MAGDGADAKLAGGCKDDLKSLSMPDLFAKLESTKDGLTGAEAAKRRFHVRGYMDRGTTSRSRHRVFHVFHDTASSRAAI